MQFKEYGLLYISTCFSIRVYALCLIWGTCFRLLIGFVFLSFQILVEKMGLPEAFRDDKSTNGGDILRM